MAGMLLSNKTFLSKMSTTCPCGTRPANFTLVPSSRDSEGPPAGPVIKRAIQSQFVDGKNTDFFWNSKTKKERNDKESRKITDIFFLGDSAIISQKSCIFAP